jgi:hypothetical protein
VRRGWRGSNPRRPAPEEQGMPALTSRLRRVSSAIFLHFSPGEYTRPCAEEGAGWFQHPQLTLWGSWDSEELKTEPDTTFVGQDDDDTFLLFRLFPTFP